jgi:hypothetical protein
MEIENFKIKKRPKLRITGLFALRRQQAARAAKNRSRATPFV